MPRPRNRIPKYCVGKNGRAFTTVDGKFFSLGKDGPDAKLKYAEVLQQVATAQPVDVSPRAIDAKPTGLSVNELCLAFLLHAQTEYLDQTTGKPSAEVDCYKSALKPLRELFGETPAAELGPNRLRLVREKYIAAGWSRGFCNKSISRIRHAWRWGVAHEMVPGEMLEALRSLEPLKRGKSAAKETRRRRAVPAADVEAVKKHLRRRGRDLVDLLLLTGARPGELVSLTTQMVQNRTTTNGVWIIELAEHKTAHHGHERRLYFNPAAQAILARYLRTDEPEARLFPIRRSAISRCLKRACALAKVSPFSAHWLRHTAATKITDESGVEAAQKVLGHAKADMTAHYSRGAEKQAVAAVQKLG